MEAKPNGRDEKSALTFKDAKILAIKNRALGDAILWTGALRVLRQLMGDGGALTVATPDRWSSVFENLPFLKQGKDSIKKIPPGKFSFFLSILSDRKKYDFILLFHASTSLAWLVRTLGVFTGAKCIINHHELFRHKDYSQIPVPGQGEVKANIDRDLDVLRAVTVVAPLKSLGDAAMPILGDARSTVSEKASGNFSKIFLGIGASRPTKAWPEKSFLELIELIRRESPVSFVVAGLSHELVAYQNLLASPHVQAFSNLTLLEVKDLIANCDFYIGNDSGLKHMAVALGLRTITVFGPESPLEWHPYPEQRHRVLYKPGLTCRTESGQHWCALKECPVHQTKCLSSISAQDVLKEYQWLTTQKSV